MAEDTTDLDNLISAFAALEGSRKRVDAILERVIGTTLRQSQAPTVHHLMASVAAAKPLSNEERQRGISYLALLAQDGTEPHVPGVRPHIKELPMKRPFVAALLAVLISSGAAMAQNASTNASPNPAVIGHADSKTSAAPVAGKNGLTKRQVAKRLRGKGYSQVKGLTKDDQGIWHGTARKAGASVNVSVDDQGNISEQ